MQATLAAPSYTFSARLAVWPKPDWKAMALLLMIVAFAYVA
jgi:hypothetical protein